MSIEKSHRPLLVAICASLFCMPFMLAGVNAVLPPIGESLEASARQLSLIGTFYSLGLAVFQLASGRLGDIFGHRHIFLLGIAVFAVCGAALGFVRSVPLFIGLRFFQGLGGAMFNASGLALLASAAPPEKRAAYLGISGAAVYAGIACGPPLAGLVTGLMGWQWLFWGNALAFAGVFLLMKVTVQREWRTAEGQPFDMTGCAIYGCAMIALTFGASELAERPTLAWVLLGAFVGLVLFFCLHELRSRYPLLDMRLLAENRVFALSSLAAFVNYSSFFGTLFFFSLYLQVGRGMEVQEAGLVLAFQAVVQALTTPLAARMCKSWPLARVSAVGVTLCGVGLATAACLSLDSSLALIFVAQALLGTGMSLFALPNTAIILESAGENHVGQASGLTGAVRTAGQLCNMVVITLTLGFFLGNAPVDAATLTGFMRCMRVDLVIFCVCNLGAIACVLAQNLK
ncbi:MAG: MFS transporter [Desulfovibrio sp.]|nr:MFS transporter [Desulfovibrio sp.]